MNFQFSKKEVNIIAIASLNLPDEVPVQNPVRASMSMSGRIDGPWAVVRVRRGQTWSFWRV